MASSWTSSSLRRPRRCACIRCGLLRAIRVRGARLRAGRLGLAASRRTERLFDTRGGRLVLGVALTTYLVLMESTMFLCVESSDPARFVAALLGLVLSYLPVRLIVFYVVTKSESRAEVVSLFLSTGFLAAQILFA